MFWNVRSFPTNQPTLFFCDYYSGAAALADLIEKAFALAATGEFRSIVDIRAELHRQGFTHYELTTLSGRAMIKTFRAEIHRSNCESKKP
jgi:hypothetical protein